MQTRKSLRGNRLRRPGAARVPHGPHGFVGRAVGAALLLALGLQAPAVEGGGEDRGRIVVRGIYGGVPETLMEGGSTLEAAGVNAVWIGERGITKMNAPRPRTPARMPFPAPLLPCWPITRRPGACCDPRGRG